MHRDAFAKRGNAHRELDTCRNSNNYSRVLNLKKLLVVVYLIFARVKESEGSGVRPELTLLEVLSQPLVPTDAASLECLRDSAIYLTALGNYTPWALQSKSLRFLVSYRNPWSLIIPSYNFISIRCKFDQLSIVLYRVTVVYIIIENIITGSTIVDEKEFTSHIQSGVF